ncbi:hypothetical protein [Parabacteroides sp. PF5-6]|uniref:hypothetical protein n=1 Tax=Parabacteroides sp. PF5-6 TaxID=1742403 RepID=UPI002405D100|nr:hypothetical protein [Parabacteroides sp. PF5-6]MDF9830476.1 hypothetical protein [Parabacteroides sp. PF5-6]
MKKIRFWYLMILWFGFSFYSYSTDNLRFADMKTLALGNNGATESVLFNPSLIALSERKTLKINYFNKYQLKELGSVSAAFLYPNRLLPVALHINSFGYDAYRESLFRISVGKILNKRWAVGVGIHYSLLETDLYEERRGRIATDIGASFRPFDNLLIGMLILNTPSVRIQTKEVENDIFTGYVLQLGFRWEIINNLLITGNMGTCEAEELTGALGVEYQAFSSFYLRAGVQAEPLLPGFGVGYGFASFTLDLATVYHPVLGMSTGIGLSYSF